MRVRFGTRSLLGVVLLLGISARLFLGKFTTTIPVSTTLRFPINGLNGEILHFENGRFQVGEINPVVVLDVRKHELTTELKVAGTLRQILAIRRAEAARIRAGGPKCRIQVCAPSNSTEPAEEFTLDDGDP